MIGKPISLVIPSEKQAEEFEVMRKVEAGVRIEHFETVRLRKDGQRLDFSVSISPIRNSGGDVAGVSTIMRDITDRKQLEAALSTAQERIRLHAKELEETVRHRTARLQEMVRELEAFSYTVSHDLRAPLRAIHQYSEVLAQDYGERLDDQARQYLRRIMSSTSRLDLLIRDVLAYSRVVRSQISLEPLPTEELVRDAMDQYSTLQVPGADIEVESPLLRVMGHKAFFTQCLSNLVGNAAKFVAPGRHPRVRIRTELRNRRVRLWVEDNGIGIAPEHRERIFGMFERVHPEGSYEGTGIGLSIVRKAVERMNGTLGVESEEGQGSKFWIELPSAGTD